MGAYVDPKVTEAHFSTRVILGFISYLHKIGRQELFTKVCAQLGVSPEYLTDDSNWFSAAFANDFIQSLSRELNDPNLMWNVGRQAVSEGNISPFEYGLMKILPPFIVFLSVPSLNHKINHITKYKIVSWLPGRIVYRMRHSLTPPRGYCSNVRGYLSSIGNVWNLPETRVNETKCIENGDDHCEMVVTFKAGKYWLRRGLLFLGYGAAYAAGYQLASAVVPAADATAAHLAGALALLSGFSLYLGIRLLSLFRFSQRYHEASEVKNSQLRTASIKLNRRYQEANLLRELALSLVRETNPKNLIESILNELEKRFGYGRTLVMLVSSDQKSLYTASVRGFDQFSQLIHKMQFKYPADKESPQLFANILERGETTFIKDINSFVKTLKPENQVLLLALGIKSMIVAPIQDADKKYGLLVAGEISSSSGAINEADSGREEKSLTEDDRHLLENLARMCSMYFQNARNFEKEQALRQIFQKYVPPVVLEGIQELTSPDGHLDPQEKWLTSFFTDIRGFTERTTAIPPEKLIDLLNHYYEFVSMAVKEEGGIVDNLVGDAVVAFFPAEDGRRTLHAERALRAALRVLSGMEEFNRLLGTRGLQSISIGIGLHSGSAKVGNVGSNIKMNFTAIGDTVNTAARLQDQCKNHQKADDGNAIAIVSAETFLRAKIDVGFKFLGNLPLKGTHDTAACLLSSEDAIEVAKGGFPVCSPERLKEISKEMGYTSAADDKVEKREADGRKKAA